MAKFQGNGVVGEIRGQFGNIVFSRNRSGAYIRGNFSPVNPNTERQQVVRSAFQSAASRWNSILTEAQREAWNSFAKNTPVVDVFGAQKTLTGFNHYVGHQTLATQLGIGNIADAPTAFGTAEIPVIEEAQMTITNADQKLNILLADVISNFDCTATDVTVGVYVGPPVSEGVNYFNGPYRFVGIIDSSTIFPLALDLPYSYPAANVKGAIQFVHYDAEGRKSKPSFDFVPVS